MRTMACQTYEQVALLCNASSVVLIEWVSSHMNFSMSFNLAVLCVDHPLVLQFLTLAKSGDNDVIAQRNKGTAVICSKISSNCPI